MIREAISALRHPSAFIDRLAERDVAANEVMQEVDAQSAAAEKSAARINRRRRRRPMPELIAGALAESRDVEGDG